MSREAASAVGAPPRPGAARPVVLVTGGSRHLGAAMCRRFAADGAAIVVNGIVPGEAAALAETLPEAIGIDRIADAARGVMRSEYEPSVDVPTGVDIRAYEAELFERWGNSALGHQTRQVGSDGSVKLRQRIPEPALLALGQGRMPHLIALTVAGYLSCHAPLGGFDPGVHAAAMTDPARERLAVLASGARDGVDLARRVIIDHRLFGSELAHQDAFAARVGELVDTIRRSGVDAAIADALSATEEGMLENDPTDPNATKEARR